MVAGSMKVLTTEFAKHFTPNVGAEFFNHFRNDLVVTAYLEEKGLVTRDVT
jgi:hypothetical protein